MNHRHDLSKKLRQEQIVYAGYSLFDHRIKSICIRYRMPNAFIPWQQSVAERMHVLLCGFSLLGASVVARRNVLLLEPSGPSQSRRIPEAPTCS